MFIFQERKRKKKRIFLAFLCVYIYLDGVGIAVAVLAQMGGSQSKTCLDGFWLAREIAQVDQSFREKILPTRAGNILDAFADA